MDQHISKAELEIMEITLLETGLSRSTEAHRLGVNQLTVCQILRQFREPGSNRTRLGLGSPRSTSVRGDKFLHLAVMQDRFQTSVQVPKLLRTISHVSISDHIVRTLKLLLLGLASNYFSPAKRIGLPDKFAQA